MEVNVLSAFYIFGTLYGWKQNKSWTKLSIEYHALYDELKCSKSVHLELITTLFYATVVAIGTSKIIDKLYAIK